jgi:hypothetical protein
MASQLLTLPSTVGRASGRWHHPGCATLSANRARVAGDPNIDNTYGALALGAVLGSLMILRALGIA